MEINKKNVKIGDLVKIRWSPLSGEYGVVVDVEHDFGGFDYLIFSTGGLFNWFGYHEFEKVAEANG